MLDTNGIKLYAERRLAIVLNDAPKNAGARGLAVGGVPHRCCGMNYHPAAELFPLIEGADFDRLVADIKANGLHDSIVVMPDNAILDGRNRQRACDAADVEPHYWVYGGDDPVGYVLSVNLHRRHLNESQRAMVASKLANMQQGSRTDLEPSANLQKVSQDKAGGMLNVSTRTVAAAAKVRAEGTPELVQAVELGRLTSGQARRGAEFGRGACGGSEGNRWTALSKVYPSQSGRGRD